MWVVVNIVFFVILCIYTYIIFGSFLFSQRRAWHGEDFLSYLCPCIVLTILDSWILLVALNLYDFFFLFFIFCFFCMFNYISYHMIHSHDTFYIVAENHIFFWWEYSFLGFHRKLQCVMDVDSKFIYRSTKPSAQFSIIST